jgi:hypothetical protein
MVFRPDGTASFVGIEHINRYIGERSGSFVLQHTGTFESGIAQTAYFVVPSSGTGDLQGLRGEGGFSAGHAQQYTTTLDYTFE